MSIRLYVCITIALLVFLGEVQGLGDAILGSLALKDESSLRFTSAPKASALSLLPSLSWSTVWMGFLGLGLFALFKALPKSAPKSDCDDFLRKPISIAALPATTTQQETLPCTTTATKPVIPKLNLGTSSSSATTVETPQEPQQAQQVQDEERVPDPTTVGYVFRPLSPRDYQRGYVSLLQQSMSVPNVSEEFFMARAKELNALENRLNIVVEHSGHIVGSATLTVEKTPTLMGERVVGHIDEVIVDKQHRRKRVGSFLLKKIADEAKERGCARICLDTDPKNEEFYNRAGFESEKLFMYRRI